MHRLGFKGNSKQKSGIVFMPYVGNVFGDPPRFSPNLRRYRNREARKRWEQLDIGSLYPHSIKVYKDSHAEEE